MKFAGNKLTFFTLFIFFALLSIEVWAGNSSHDDPRINGNFVEGPHVFYKKGRVYVKKVQFKSGTTKLISKSYASKTEVPTLKVMVDDEQKTSFEIKLNSDYVTPPTIYEQPKKLFAIADIEGNFEAFSKSLKGNKIIDEDFNWIYGDGHLVLVGDFVDRGHNVTPVLWLIYKLDQEAIKAGGMVHFIVGNHEEMNMRGDLRYVKERYLKTAKVMKTAVPQLYSQHTELGRWMRSKNVVEKIGRTIFVHGGLSPMMAHSRIRLEQMNKYARKYFGTEKWRLEQKGGGGSSVFSKYGPMWYRGYFREEVSQKELNNVLDLYGAKEVVVGHTIVPNISYLFEHRVIAIDVKHEVALSAGIPNAILIEGGKIVAVDMNGKQSIVGDFLTQDYVKSVFNAVKTGDQNTVNAFLKTEHRINQYFFSNRITLLQIAIQNHQYEIVKLLAENGANLNLLSENMTPLMHAIKAKNPAIINFLIDNGADTNGRNRQDKTPLFYCAKHGDTSIAKILIEHGAQIDLKDRKGRTAMEYALKNDNKSVAIYLEGFKQK